MRGSEPPREREGRTRKGGPARRGGGGGVPLVLQPGLLCLVCFIVWEEILFEKRFCILKREREQEREGENE